MDPAGKREPKEEGEKVWPKQSEVKPDSNLALAQKSRRFMIYVHSKLLIADDEVPCPLSSPLSSLPTPLSAPTLVGSLPYLYAFFLFWQDRVPYCLKVLSKSQML